MAQVLRCCSASSLNEPYIGVDEKCYEPAVFCIEHSSHKNTEGLMHQMLPLKHFKKTLQQKKFHMNEKIGILIDQYNSLMDSLIEQIRELKLRKNIEFSMLWLRQLAKDEEEYELMRQIYRMDFKDLTCALVHSIYFKIVHNQILEKKTVKEIGCYKGIAQILEHLSQQKQARSFLSKKIAQIEGILQNGQILKRALPDKLVHKQNIKQVLLQSPSAQYMDIKYNKCRLTRNSRQYISIFSKYPIVPHVLYHLNFSTKYTNVMLGVCTEGLVEQGKRAHFEQDQSGVSDGESVVGEFDQHYSKDSLVFNCTNGCVYKDGMFESGGSGLTKGLKELVLKLRITSTNQLIIMLGKNVLCRQKLNTLMSRNNKEDTRFFLHVLLRTQGDSFDVDRDKEITGDELPFGANNIAPSNSTTSVTPTTSNPREHINFDQIRRRNQEEVMNVNSMKEEILSGKGREEGSANPRFEESSSYSHDFRHFDSSKLIGQINAGSDTQINRQQQDRKESVKKEIQKIEKNKKHLLAEQQQPLRQKPLNDHQKQQKINEIIKRQRIDKILNDIKSKPMPSGDGENNGNNSIVARKLREIQERRNDGDRNNKGVASGKSNAYGNSAEGKGTNGVQAKYRRESSEQSNRYQQNDNESNPATSINNDSSYVQQSQSDHPALLILKPVTIQNNRLNADISGLSSYQGSSSNIHSPIAKSCDIDPLLIMPKPQGNNNGSLFPKSGDYINKIGEQEYGKDSEESQYRPKMNKLRPSQKIFKLDQDQSYQFNDGLSPDQYSPLSGGVTPIDKINEFQFAKKSLHLKSSLQKNVQANKRSGIYSNYNNPNAKKLPVLFETEQKPQQSRYNDDSNNRYPPMGSPVISVNEVNKGATPMPQLKHSHFSKMTSKSNLTYSDMGESFGGYNQFREGDNDKGYGGGNRFQHPNNHTQESAVFTSQNPMKRMTEIESAVNIDFQSSRSLTGGQPVRMGNIIEPKGKINTFEEEQSFVSGEKSFDRVSGNSRKHDQSLINIRGTMFQ